ncbi:MAG: glycosyltransferase family 2 protein, partial [Nitrososphaera sp.]|nr:glycosyltransferase family 2 protein [Nitrososphaera sp.]
NIYPTVSFIITAYNEEARIREKIENTLQQNYPPDRFEIVIASDCSTDGTDDIVRSYESRGVRLLRATERMGKEAAQKLAVESTSGAILVFSDVATLVSSDGVSNIVKNFSDPTVGCVSSVDRFVDSDGRTSGEGAYVKYEMLLRRLETKVNTLVGLSGSFFAVRREVCQSWAADLQSDFNTLLNAAKSGLRGVSDPDSIGYYKNLADERKEYERKVRTVLRGISVLMKSLPMLNPFKYHLFSWQLFSHKLCRWLVPFAMILAFVSNMLLIPSSAFYQYTFGFQLAFYGIALAYLWIQRLPKKDLLRIPSFVLVANLSILDAWYRYLRGERILGWDPSKR